MELNSYIKYKSLQQLEACARIKSKQSDVFMITT